MGITEDINTYVSISVITAQIKNTIENRFTLVRLRGEISNFRPASSGHWYFSLKDGNATIKAIVFKNTQSSIIDKFAQSVNSPMPANGQEILAEGRISLYEKGGEYSIIITQMKPVGAGELALKFEELKQKLNKLGYFEQTHKISIPKFPQTVGIVTSPTGAALQDILTVLSRRHAGIKIIVYPASVQGESAKYEIVKAIETADYHYKSEDPEKPDILIVARGGGSIEDLWCFNEEIVANAIYNAEIPVITGIGHEVDFTIADFCADLRAPTPSAAAEIVSSDRLEVIDRINANRLRLEYAIGSQLRSKRIRVENNSPNIIFNRINKILEMNAINLDHCTNLLNISLSNTLNSYRNRFSLAIRSLDNLSPLKTLQRGYSIVTDSKGDLISESSKVCKGELINIKLLNGDIEAEVIQTNS